MSPKALRIEANFVRYEEEEQVKMVDRVVDIPVHTKKEVAVIEEEVVIKEIETEIISFEDIIEEEVEERITYKHVPVKEVVEVPKEIFSYTPEVETRVIEQIIEVPGMIIERPVTKVEDREIITHVYKDVMVPISYDTKVFPCVHEDPHEVMDVELVTYVPKPIEVETAQPKVIRPPLKFMGEEHHHVAPIDPATVSAAEYNSTLLLINSHLVDTEHYSKLPFRVVDGHTPFLQEGTKMSGTVVSPETACIMEQMNKEFHDCVRCQHPSSQREEPQVEPQRVEQPPIPSIPIPQVRPTSHLTQLLPTILESEPAAPANTRQTSYTSYSEEQSYSNDHSYEDIRPRSVGRSNTSGSFSTCSTQLSEILPVKRSRGFCCHADTMTDAGSTLVSEPSVARSQTCIPCSRASRGYQR
ncbi:MAG: uncharacterized protein KVP18_000047 [Porospora cf. gigantea A]|uniref:uncharacterized protein n=1 Tax=Porospora cf. gigantea A TaxID=2853593 RepID=UPI0035594140|nr:MAG: hypothetical protein KVP18_000047 [Porospora cf. gigantea A]